MGDFEFRISNFELEKHQNSQFEIRNSKCSSWLLTNRGKQNRFGRKLRTDPYLAFHFPDACFAADDLHDNPHLIARNNGPAKLGLVYSQKVDECFAEVGVLFE